MPPDKSSQCRPAAALTPTTPRLSHALWWVVTAVRAMLVTTFVLAYLAIMLWRNVASLCQFDARDPDDQPPPLVAFNTACRRFETQTSLAQGWAMYNAPVWRRSPFPAVDITFDDGTALTILSDNEPANLARFVRWNHGRLRRWEDYLCDKANADTLPTRLLPAYESYIRWRVRAWRAANPHDQRPIVTAAFVDRTWYAPEIDALPRQRHLKQTLRYVWDVRGWKL